MTARPQPGHGPGPQAVLWERCSAWGQGSVGARTAWPLHLPPLPPTCDPQGRVSRLDWPSGGCIRPGQPTDLSRVLSLRCSVQPCTWPSPGQTLGHAPRVDFQRREAGRGQWGWGVTRKPLSLWVLWSHLISDPRTFITCSPETQPKTAPAGDGLVCAPPSVPGQVSLLRVPVPCTCGI